MVTPHNYLYTWTGFQGNVSLVSKNEEYQFCYTNAENQTHIIPQNDVTGISLPQQVDAIHLFCQNFYFRKEKEKFVFFECASRDDFDESEEISTTSISKALGHASFQFNKLEGRKYTQFSSDAPRYRVVGAGLNLEGACTSQSCVAGKIKAWVIVPKGIGIFNVIEELCRAQCPACEGLIGLENMKNLGFWKCTFILRGQQVAPEFKNIDQQAEEAEEHHYTTFASTEECTWRYLTADVKHPKV